MTNTTNAALECIPEYLPPEPSTRRIPVQTMSTLVYGPRRRPLVSRRIAFRAALLGAVIGLVGCATAPRPVVAEVETVGQLTASSSHVYVAPVHASTNLSAAVGTADTGDIATDGRSSLDVLRAEVAAGAGDVAVAAKADGVTAGPAR